MSNTISQDDPSSTQPRTHNPENLIVPVPTYHQVAITPLLPTSRLITLAGQTGVRKDGTIDSDLLSQVRQAYRNVHEALKSANATPRDIIHIRHYIVQDPGIESVSGKADGKEEAVYDRGWPDLWIEFMDKEGEGHRPPDTVLGVAGLAVKGLLYEVEVWAVVSR